MAAIKVAVLVDLPREKGAGGHVKYWERIAQAAAACEGPVDLTLYFSGTGADEVLSPRMRIRFLPPVFSTARLKFLPYVPAHTDLAPFHRRLARELVGYDVIHTTDAFFAFARTAEKIARRHRIPLVTSLHTDTPAYAELFTRQTLISLLGKKWGLWLDRCFKISSGEGRKKSQRLAQHLRVCDAVMAMRSEDIDTARNAGSGGKIKPMRLGVDKAVFRPDAQARTILNARYGIAADKFVVQFVGRVDAGKNIPLLLNACLLARQRGLPVHLVVTGQGPLAAQVQEAMGADATITGLLTPAELALHYAAADCLAIASDIEIGGLIGLEAMSCGCPVLVSRASGVAQLCNGTAAMQMVDSTAEAWAGALFDLYRDKARQAAMRAAALDFRRDLLAGWDQVLEQDFIPVWQSVAHKEHP